MRFIADAMLGKLAKWMKILGYDVEYSPKISDEELIDRAHQGNRLILTRDTLLIKRKRAREISLFISSDHYDEQLQQVLSRYPPGECEVRYSRCLLCNVSLLSIERDEVRGRVPPYVYETQKGFSRCPSCGRLFWRATHVERMEERIRSMRPTQGTSGGERPEEY